MFGILLLSLGTVLQLFAADDSGYFSVTGPCNLEFPKDHGSHSGYRTEWWYYTGNVDSENGNRFGFQLTFFRSQLSPAGASRHWPKPASQWRTQHIYLAHAAISDLAGGRHLHAEESSRGALGLAGVALNETRITTVHLKNWYAKIGPENQHLKAATDRFAFDLELIPTKKPILHGEAGYSRKGRASESASCYYSFTRLKTRGSLTLNGKTFAVEGLSWMDHEFSTAPLEPGIVGWDWFSLILSDRTELMVYVLRQKDGTINPASSGTFVDPDGNSRHLTKEEFRVLVLDSWKSPNSEALYPVRWRLSVFPLSMELSIVSNLADQELQTTESTGVTYWEGSVSITGTANDHRIEGQGYVELTGYAKAFDAPM
ncbi:MAG: carotenoid 1,2-hydratase [Deltaproteobacteria bacterium]|nr:MAG: carotenoid 1,2-hydratase [Deltaproteobacteria bacterium]